MKRSFLPVLALIAFMAAGDVRAQVPRIITYQGVLSDVSGSPVPNGARTMTLNIYDAPTGGNLLYSETQSVNFVRGVFNVAIGSVTPLPASLKFDRPYYLGISLESAAEFSPRPQFTTSAYAIRSSHAAVADSLSPTASGVITSINGRSGAMNIIGSGNTTVTQSGGTITINSTGVSSLNGVTGNLEIEGEGGAVVTRNGNRFTIAAVKGIQGVAALDPSVTVIDGNGPTPKVGVSELGITANKIANSAVTSEKIADGSVNGMKIAAASVATAHLADGAVISSKITSNAVTTDKIADGSVTTPKLADGSVNGAKLGAGVITTSHLADGSVTTPKLADGSVVTSKMVDGSVTTAKVADGGIVTGKIADGAVTTAKIAGGSVVTASLADGSVTSEKIGAGAVGSGNLADGSVTTAKLADGAVMTMKIADSAVIDSKIASISYGKVIGAPSSLPPTGPAGGDLSGGYPNPTVAFNAITTPKIADASVTMAKIADNAVGSVQIVDASIVTGKIYDAAVITSKLADNSVTNAKVADGAVTTPKMVDGSVTLPKVNTAGATNNQAIVFDGTNAVWGTPIPGGAAGGDLTGTYPNPTVAAGAITSAKIADGTIVDADVSPTAAIAYSKLALTNSIQNSDLTANSVTTSKVANGTVTTSKLADSAVSGLKLLTYAVTDRHIADGAVTLPKVNTAGATNNQAIVFDGTNAVWGTPIPGGSAGGDLTGTYPNPTVAAGAITSAKIADGTIVDADVSPTAAIAYSKLALTNSIQNSDLTANSVTTSKVANGTVTTSKLADSAVSGLKLLTYAVTDRHIADGAVTLPKISTTGASANQAIMFDGTNLVWGAAIPGGSAGGDLTGTYPNPTVANDAITSAKIADGTITNADVSATAAIQYSKLALTNSIQNGDIVANAITTSKVANGTVTTSKLADSAVSGLKLLTYAVTNRHIADGAVSTSKMDPAGASGGSVLTYNGTNVVWAAASAGGAAGGDLTGTYPNPTIANDAITSAKIADGTITNADVSATAAIQYSKLALTNSIQNGDIVANAITTSKVANGTVTTSKLADSAVSGLKLLTYAVTNRHIADGAVSLSKIDPAGASSGNVITYNGTNLVWSTPATGATGAAGGDLTGTYPNPTVANDAITSAKIQDGAVNNQDLAANSVTTSKVANGTVTTSKMADSAISGLKLLTFAVTNRHLADGAVTTAKISGTGASTGNVLTYDGANVVWSAPAAGGATGPAGGDLSGTYPNPAVANDAITSAKIADGTITNADIVAAAGIPYSKLTLTNSIQNIDIVANAITTSKVANGTVTTSKMADSAISGLKLLTFAVTNRHLANGAVSLPKIDPAGATTNQVITYDGTNVVWSTPTGGGATGAAGGDLTGTYPNPAVANDAITSAKIADGTITNADIVAAAGIPYSKLTLTNSIQNIDIVANAITTSKVANGTVTTSKLADSAVSGLKLLTFAVTNRHLADGAVTPQKVSGGGAVNGQVLTYNSATNTVGWANPSVGLAFNRVAISNINSPYTVPAGTDIVGVDVTAGPVTVTLPPANSVASGKIIIVKNELGNAATNNITIQRNGTDLINASSTSVSISTGNGTNGFSFYSDGVSRWHQY